MTAADDWPACICTVDMDNHYHLALHNCTVNFARDMIAKFEGIKLKNNDLRNWLHENQQDVGVVDLMPNLDQKVGAIVIMPSKGEILYWARTPLGLFDKLESEVTEATITVKLLHVMVSLLKLKQTLDKGN